MPRTQSKRELDRIDLFMRTMRGIPTGVLAQVMSWESTGIDWRGSSKGSMAEGWAREDENAYFGRASRHQYPHPDLEKVKKLCLEHVQRISDSKARQAEMANQLRQGRALAIEQKKVDDLLLLEVFEFAEHNLQEMGAMGKLSKVIALRNRLLPDRI